MTGVARIVVPSSVGMTIDNPRLETFAIGTIGRAAAIFGVDEIVVYEDEAERAGRRVSRILDYQATAPYLRKRLFPISEELEHVGVLPPLNLPLHLVPSFVEEDQLRMGAMTGKRVDIGLEEQAELDLEGGEDPPEPGQQFPVKVTAARSDRVQVRPVDPDEYASFSVRRTPNLSTALEGGSPLLGTSREGEPFDEEDHLFDEDCTLVFGTPERGIREILDREVKFPLVNTIPDQHTRSVRVEEALMASLAIINDRRHA